MKMVIQTDAIPFSVLKRNAKGSSGARNGWSAASFGLSLLSKINRCWWKLLMNTFVSLINSKQFTRNDIDVNEHFCTCPRPGHGFPMPYVVWFFF